MPWLQLWGQKIFKTFKPALLRSNLSCKTVHPCQEVHHVCLSGLGWVGAHLVEFRGENLSSLLHPAHFWIWADSRGTWQWRKSWANLWAPHQTASESSQSYRIFVAVLHLLHKIEMNKSSYSAIKAFMYDCKILTTKLNISTAPTS